MKEMKKVKEKPKAKKNPNHIASIPMKSKKGKQIDRMLSGGIKFH